MTLPHGVYVYGLVRGGEPLDLGRIGLEHDGAPARVYSLESGPVAAVVSAFEAGRRPAPLRRHLEPHHRVVQEALARTTILPVTFGHVAAAEDEVAEILERRREDIAAELSRLDGTIEMRLKVCWQVPNVFRHIVDAYPGLSEMRHRIFERTGRPTHAEKLELGRMFERRLKAEKALLTERLCRELGPHALDTASGVAYTETQIADLHFLLPRTRAADFEVRVNAVASEWPAEVAFECSGPWAPAHFVRLDLHEEDLCES
jgi:hypothetical protein